MRKYIYTLLLLALSISLTSAGKGDFATTLHKYLNIYNTDFPQEKIYIQTDKTYYKPSDDIWYKAFLIDANKNTPSRVSNVIHIELHDPKGNIIQKREHALVSGSINGDFNISEDLPGGIYKLVAYSRWMQNWGEEMLFTKEITVQKVITPRLLLKLDFEKRAYGRGDEVVANLLVTDLDNNKTTGSIATSTIRVGGVAVQTVEHETTQGKADIKFRLPMDLKTADGILQIVVSDRGTRESITRSIPIILSRIDLQFYPEGGNIIGGTQNKVAFEGLNEFGKGADISGYIVDDMGVKVSEFSSFHLGMGAFEFTPQSDKKYFAKIETPLGNDDLIPLPQVLKKGYVLNLKSKDKEKLQWTVYSSQATSAYLVGQTQGEIYYNTRLDLKKGMNTIETPLDKFPIGVAVFSLFDSKNEGVCERLVFLNADKGLHLSIKTDKKLYAPGEKVSVTIESKDNMGNPVAASLGLAVVDEQLMTLADDKQDNLLSHVLFSSELKGKIYEPYFYFNPEEEKAKEAIDYLMLTHGWRRFNWDDVLKLKSVDIKNRAENNSTVYGYVLNEAGKPTQAEVFLIENANPSRIGNVHTTREGHFTFRNINANCENIFITTKLPNQVYLFSDKIKVEKHLKSLANEDDMADGASIIKMPEKQEIVEEAVAEANREVEIVESKDMSSFSFADGDDLQLDEVVVVGYSSMKKSDITGSISTVDSKDIMVNVTNSNLAGILGGAVAGIRVVPQNTSPDQSQGITIRGTSSNISGSDPLVVLDDIPIPGSYASALSFINPSEIAYITILKNASATAIYGNRAANGVIYIQTKNTDLNVDTKTVNGKIKYGGVVVNGRQYYVSKAFRQNNNDSENITTVFWDGNIKTNDEGKAKLSFYNAKHSSTFRITAEGLATKAGLIGSKIEKIVTRKPFSIDAKTPLFVGVGDKVDIPVMLRNATADTLHATIEASMKQEHLILDNKNRSSNSSTIKATIPPNESTTIYFSAQTGNTAGVCNMQISGSVGKYNNDVLNRKIVVRQINFPYQYSFSGSDSTQTESLDLMNYIPGSLQAEAVCYTDVIDELFDGVESIFREPYGCFEQVSSSTFPNIFALQLLQGNENLDEKVKKKAMTYLENGYKKLAAYEVKGGGFEWYGGTPAHEVLSAYGLVQFHEMNKVYPKVDQKMVERTHGYLLSRKDGKGGFEQNSGKYGFSGSPKNVSNAYIVYALTETSDVNDIEKEYNTALQEALTSKDLYRMALMANAAYNKGDKDSYTKLVELFREYMKVNPDPSTAKIEASIVRSYGAPGNREMIAFWMIALLKDKDNLDENLISECLRYINKGRCGGSFGNTQTTSICLQALTRYTEQFSSDSKASGRFYFNVNGANLYKSITTQKVKIPFSKELITDKNIMQVRYQDTKKVYPYTINVAWQSKTPPTSKLCPLKLTTSLASTTTKVNETVRLVIKLTNTDKDAKPMTVAVIGIPGGMSLQPWQLKELQDKGVFDFYEIINDNLVIYYREMGPREVKSINIDLKAEIPGTYTGIASSAYIYYMNEHKYWIDGISTTIAKQATE